MNKYYLFILFLGFITISSCKSKKEITDITIHDPQFYQDKIFSHNFKFDWYAAKATVRMEDKYETITAKLYLRMSSGDSIWLVGKKLGIEGIRMLITNDSLFVINRQERSYYKTDYSGLKYEYGVDFEFDQLQDVLAGNIIVHKDSSLVEQQLDSTAYTGTQQLGNYTIKHWLDLLSLQLNKTEIADNNNRTIKIEYSDYKEFEPFKYTPYLRKYHIPETEYGDMFLDLNFSEIEIDIPQEMPFSIPSHYERIQ